MPITTKVARNIGEHIRLPKNTPTKFFRHQDQAVHPSPRYPVPTRDYYGDTQMPAVPPQEEDLGFWERLLGKNKKKKQKNHGPQVPSARVREGHRRAPMPTTRPTHFIGPDGRLVPRPSLNRGNSTARHQRQIAKDEALARRLQQEADAELAQQLHAREQRELRQATRRQTPHPTTPRQPTAPPPANVLRNDREALRAAAREAQRKYKRQGILPITVPEHQGHVMRPPHRRAGEAQPNIPTRNNTNAARDAATRAQRLYTEQGIRPDYQAGERAVTRRLTQRNLEYKDTVGAQLGLDRVNGKAFNNIYDILLGKSPGKNPKDYAININSEVNADDHIPHPNQYFRAFRADGSERKRFRNTDVEVLLLNDYSQVEHQFAIPRSKLPKNLVINTNKNMALERAYHEKCLSTYIRNLRQQLRLAPHEPLPHKYATNLPSWIGDPGAPPEQAKRNFVKWLKTLENPVAPRVQDGRRQRATPLNRGNSTARHQRQITEDEALARRLQQEADAELAQQLHAWEQRELGQAATHRTPQRRQAAPANVLRNDTKAIRAAARDAQGEYERRGILPITVPGYPAGAPRAQRPVARVQIHLPKRINHTNQYADIMNSYTVSQLAHNPAKLDHYNKLLLMQSHIQKRHDVFEGSNPFVGIDRPITADGRMTDEARALFEANRSSYHRLANQHADWGNRSPHQLLAEQKVRYQQVDLYALQQANNEIGRDIDISRAAGRIVSVLENTPVGRRWLLNNRFNINNLSGGRKSTKEILDTVRHSLARTPAGKHGVIPEPLGGLSINEHGPNTELTFLDKNFFVLGDRSIYIPTDQIPLTVLRDLRNRGQLLGRWLGVGDFPNDLHIELGAGLHTYD